MTLRDVPPLRRRSPGAQRRDRQVVLRFSEVEFADVCASAGRAGLAVRAWLGNTAVGAARAEAGDCGDVRRRLLRELVAARTALSDEAELVQRIDGLVDLLVAAA